MAKRRDNRSLRYGYTTGACAAAAAKAAAVALLKQSIVRDILISLPNGNEVVFQIDRCFFDPLQATCSVIKDAGDDPDVTNGAEIQATVSWQDQQGMTIEGGQGVGIVTKPGLGIPIGTAAINPVPRQMIVDSITNAVGGRKADNGIKVIISVPNGEQLAKRTLNHRLGIVNGISILGTTGIVIPYSVDAYTVCISQALDVAVASGCRQVVLTTGRQSEKLAQQHLNLPEESFVLAGDFIGYSLDECAKRGLDKVTIWGMIGKISKLADGHLQTNISDSQVNLSLLTEIAKDCGISKENLEMLREAVTASQFIQMLPAEMIPKFCIILCQFAATRCRESINFKLEVECIMTGQQGIIMGIANAKG